MVQTFKLSIVQVDVNQLNPAPFNPRRWSEKQISDLKESIKRFSLCDPLIVNGNPKRKGVVIGGHMRLAAAKELGYKKVPVIFLNIPDLKKEKELNLRLNKNIGAFDFEILKDFDMDLLLDVGFSNEDFGSIWDLRSRPKTMGFKFSMNWKKSRSPKPSLEKFSKADIS